MLSVSSATTNGLLRRARPAPPPTPAQSAQAQSEQAQPQLALLPVLAIAAAVTAVLVAYAGQYGYNRDELYYLAAGQHLAWGYPDMPPFVPLLARLLSDLAPGSLVVLRLLSALSGGVMILLTAMITRELRGGRAVQLLACAVMAVAPLIAIFHEFTTEAFDLLVSVLLCWLIIRILRTGEQRLWLVTGLVTGTGLLDSDLVAFLILGIVFGLALSGPRWPLRSGWFYIVPVSVLHKTPFTTNYDLRETIGWSAYVQEIAQVYNSLPAAKRSVAAIVTSNYGEGGDVDRFGSAYGLPAAYSPHDGFWYWGPPPTSKTVAVIAGSNRAELSQLRLCGSLRPAATLNNHVGIADEEQGVQVWVCTDLVRSWEAIWPQVHF